MFNPSDLIGLTLEEALASAKANNHTIRVLHENGEHLFGTCDWCPERINIAIDDNVVTAILNLG